jgi:hypothetical protein
MADDKDTTVKEEVDAMDVPKEDVVVADESIESKPVEATVDITAETATTDAKQEDSVTDASVKEEGVVTTVEEPSTERKKKRKQSVESGSTKPAAAMEGTENSSKRERRERKAVETFDPQVYNTVDKNVEIVEGRGIPIKEMRPCLESVKSYTNTDDISMAYRFLFTSRGKVSKKDMIQSLMDFSGYLPKKDPNLPKKEQDKIVEDLEVMIRRPVSIILVFSFAPCPFSLLKYLLQSTRFCLCFFLLL